MKKLTTLLAFLTFAAGLWAIDNVAYIDANGIHKYQNNVTEITSTSSVLSEGWYVVLDEEVTTGALVCNGEVHLILADGAMLTATADYESTAPGIQVSGNGNSLTIYGQSAQSGQLIANGAHNAAGIGGGEYASGSHITINGGIITANGGDSGAGIGGGFQANGYDITINGGTVTANGYYGGAGIGSGESSETSSNNIFVANNFIVKAGDSENPTIEIEPNHLATTDLAINLAGKAHVTIAPPTYIPTSYIDANGEEQTASAYKIADRTSTLNAGWYVVTDDITTGTLVCNGAVNLILADGAKLTANGTNNQAGIEVSGDNNSLTIYGQSAQSGQLIANGDHNAAGIGGGENASGSHITINGGIITANGGDSGAGIGGGNRSNGSNITINGGIVTAYGGESAAGIGGGDSGNGSNITINGGIVTANGSNYDSAGIGGGHGGNGSNITINGGKVIANGSQGCTGIGSGKDGSASSKIYVATNLIVKAGDTANPIYAIATTRQSTTDITSDLTGKRFVVIEPDPFILAKKDAIAAINEEIKDADDENVKAIAADAVDAINAVETIADVTLIKNFALSAIEAARAAYLAGQEKLYSGTDLETSGPAVEIKKGDKTIVIYAPDQVSFKKQSVSADD